jgi:hypothetical protein
MSTRLCITACDLKKMNSWFGSKDTVVQKKLVKELEALVGDEDFDDEDADDDQEDMLRDAVNRIPAKIHDGVVRSEGKESAGDVCAAYALARQARVKPQPWDDADEDEWSWMELIELSEQFKKRFDSRTQTLLEYCVTGRALFYTEFGDDCGWYGYLTNAETKEFKELLSKAHKDACELVDSGALNEVDFDSKLLIPLEYILETMSRVNGSDLFIYAS